MAETDNTMTAESASNIRKFIMKKEFTLENFPKEAKAVPSGCILQLMEVCCRPVDVKTSIEMHFSCTIKKTSFHNFFRLLKNKKREVNQNVKNAESWASFKNLLQNHWAIPRESCPEPEKPIECERCCVLQKQVKDLQAKLEAEQYQHILTKNKLEKRNEFRTKFYSKSLYLSKKLEKMGSENIEKLKQQMKKERISYSMLTISLKKKEKQIEELLKSEKALTKELDGYRLKWSAGLTVASVALEPEERLIDQQAVPLTEVSEEVIISNESPNIISLTETASSSKCAKSSPQANLEGISKIRDDKYQLHNTHKGHQSRQGKWSKEEVQVLQMNTDIYCKIYNIKDLAEAILQMSQAKKTEFYKKMALGIDRPSNHIRMQLKQMYKPQARRRYKVYKESELEHLKLLQAKHGNDWAAIGKALGRTAISVKEKCSRLRRCGHLLETDESGVANKSFKKIKETRTASELNTAREKDGHDPKSDDGEDMEGSNDSNSDESSSELQFMQDYM